MKTIQNDELYENLRGFLQSKGIEFQTGGYPARIRQACARVTQAVNLAQKAAHKAKTEVDAGLEKMRQVIHEKTAPKPSPTPSPATGPEAAEPPTAAAAPPAGPAPQPAEPPPRRQSPTRKPGQKRGRRR
jgi:hypothetical protein